MARVTYNPSTGLGELLSEGANQILDGRYKLKRFLEAFAEMTPDDIANEIGMEPEEYDAILAGLAAIESALYTNVINHLSRIDQG